MKMRGRGLCTAFTASCLPAAMAWKTLYYFSTDLSNSGVRSSGFLKFCAGLAPGNSLLKSASYLLHSGNFSTVRDFIPRQQRRHHSGRLGIPLEILQPEEKWKFFPFGRYAGPIAEFPGKYQEQYAELFRTQPADEFRYRLSLALRMRSNLLLSVRLAADEAAPSRHDIIRRAPAGAKTAAARAPPRTNACRATERRFFSWGR